MMMKNLRKLRGVALTAAFLALATKALAQFPVNYEASLMAGAGSGEFAPYYISALSHGKISSRYNAAAEAKAWRPLSLDTRFSYGFGVDLMAGYASSRDYLRYDVADKKFEAHSLHPSRVWIQQLYGEVKYRGAFLTVGMKEHGSALLNQRLSSGDLVESGNARPIPEVRVGFVDFQNIPFTNGWVQIQGETGWGKNMDSDWWADHYNEYNYHIAQGTYYNYKRCYFRTKPSQPLSVTVGMQAAAVWGGTTKWYSGGVVTRTQSRKLKFGDLFKTLIPMPGGSEDFYDGNHLGTWDFQARYRLNNDDEVKAYFSWPWEDGSGIGRRNGWDGLWGVEYKKKEKGLVSGVVVEYMDYTNQSGPQHYAPGDHPGTDLTSQSTGADDYYNNGYFNSYAYYGMSIGTPALMAPIYNLDGYPAFLANRLRGFHAAAEGSITEDLDYRVAVSYRKAWGNGHNLFLEPIHDTSALVEVSYDARRLTEGLKIKGQIGLDRGNMPGNNFGAMVTVSYDGTFNF